MVTSYIESLFYLNDKKENRKKERKKILHFYKKTKNNMIHLTILLVTFYTKAENVVGRVHEKIKLRLENA